MTQNYTSVIHKAAAVLLLATASVGAAAQDDGYMLQVPQEPVTNCMDLTANADGSYTCHFTGYDPFIQLASLTRDLTDEETYITFEYQATKDVSHDLEFFFSPIAGGRSLNVGGYLATKEGEWQEMNIDISAKRQEYGWGKKGDFLRFDMGWANDMDFTFRNLRIHKLSYDLQETMQIGNAEQLNHYMNMVNGGLKSLSAQLTSDIDFTAYDNRFLYLEGTLDGQGHTITVNYDVARNNAALIEHLYGQVRNLRVSGSIATDSDNAAGIAAHLNRGTISNCISDVTITSTRPQGATHGGIVAEVSNAGRIDNTVFAGKFVSDVTTACGGFVGWASAPVTLNNCLFIGSVEMSGEDSETFGRNTGNVTLSNCYYTSTFGSVQEGAIALSGADAVTSGEACYKLNGTQESIQWYQTIGTDAHPIPFATGGHKQVYAAGDLRCDGSMVEGGAVTYSNENTQRIPDHEYQNGVCVVCGHLDKDYLPLDESGFRNIPDVNGWKWFVAMVAAGSTDMNVRLTADLDLAEVEMQPIGTYDAPYKGTFDGQHHIISNLSITDEERTGVGLFGTIDSPAIISNVVLDENCHITGKDFVGLIGRIHGDMKGEVHMTGLGNMGTITGISGCVGGILGCAGGSGNMIYENCYSTGNITAANSATALAGWAHNSRMTSCWSTAEVTGYESEAAYLFRGPVEAINVCSTKGAQCTVLPDDAAGSGELCYHLNGGQMAGVAWYQTLGEDAYPVLDSSHGLVYMVDDEYASINSAEDFTTYRDRTLESDRNWLAEAVATKSYVERYLEAANALADYDDRDTFISEYTSLTALRDSIKASETAYAQYATEIERIAAVLQGDESFAGATRTLLEKYIGSKEAPSDNLPNGTYQYIYGTHELTTDEVKAETAFATELLQRAISEGYTKDSDITSLMANADFTDGFNGWEGEMATSVQDGKVTADGKAFDMHQTLTGLAKGLYEVQAQGEFLPAGDTESTNHAAMLYANDSRLYLPTVAEADGQASVIVAEVTDGTLTIGIKNEGTGCSGDKVDFSNIKLYYRGAVAEAATSLDTALKCYATRANTISAYECWDDGDYAQRPNFQGKLREDLSADAAKGTAEGCTAQEKYALVSEMSALMQQIYDCKQAYVRLVKEMEDINSAYQGEFEGSDAVFNLYVSTWGIYNAGQYSTEQCLAEIEKMKQEWPRDYITLDPDKMLHSLDIVISAPFTYDLTVTDGDPFVATSELKEDLPAEKTIMQFEYKTDYSIRGEFFFFSPFQNWSEEWMPTLAPAAEWTKAGFDFTEYRETHLWSAAGSYLRWDPVQDGLVTLSIRNIKFVTPEEFNGGTPDGITLSPMQPAKESVQGIYTLSGQRVNKAVKGIYIIDGKKVLVK